MIGHWSIKDAYYAFATLSFCVVAIKAMLRWYANLKIQQQFIADIGTNHLRHIYHALSVLADNQGITLGEPPPIKWTEVNGNSKH